MKTEINPQCIINTINKFNTLKKELKKEGYSLDSLMLGGNLNHKFVLALKRIFRESIQPNPKIYASYLAESKSIDTYNIDLENMADEMVKEIAIKINNIVFTDETTEHLKYPRQMLLETVIQKLQDIV